MSKMLSKNIIMLIVISLTLQAASGIIKVGVRGEENDWMYQPDVIVPDDYPTIQAAIDNSNSGECVGIRPGVYHEALCISENCFNGLTIVGKNCENTVITGNEIIDTDTILLSNLSLVTIANLKITGSGQGYNESRVQYNNYGIKCSNSDDILIEHCIIEGNGNGINCDSAAKITIRDNEIINNLDDGIDGNGEFYIYNNNISNNGYGFPSDITNGDGIEIMRSSRSSEIVNNIISYNAVDGVWDETIDDHLIMDNYIHHNGQSGIHLEEGRDCKIKNNRIYNNGFGEFGRAGAGILFLHCTSNSIVNNEIFNNKRGIHLDQSHSNEISDNDIYKNKRVGIDFDQTSRNQVFNNVVRENFIGFFLKFASGFRISYNDIYLNNLFGMVSFMSFGSATFNWWGNMFGPYMVQMLRLPPLLTMVVPWSTHRINGEE